MNKDVLDIFLTYAEKFAFAFITFAVIILAILIFIIICEVKLFKKCGKPGWAAIIPFYSTWVLGEIAGTHWGVFVCAILGSALDILGFNLSDGVNAIINIIELLALIAIYINVSKKFHKDTGFTVGLVLLSFIFIPILALDNSCQFDDSVPVKKFGFFE